MKGVHVVPNNLVFFNDAVTLLKTVKHFITHHNVTEQIMEQLTQFEGVVCSLGTSSPKYRN